MIKKLKIKISHDEHFRELLKGSGISFSFKVLGILLGYIFTLLVARLYNADTVGLFSISFTLLNILVTLGLLGFDNSIIKFMAQYKNMELKQEIYMKAIFASFIISSILIIILLYNIDFIANEVFDNTELKSFLYIVSYTILPLVLLRLNAAVFRGIKNIKLFSLFQNVGIYLFAIIYLIIGYKLGMNNIVSIKAFFLGSISLSLTSIIYVYKKRLIKLVKKQSLTYRTILSVSIPMLLITSISFIMSWTDILMLGIMRSENEVGIYSIAAKLAETTTIVLFAINSIAAPKFAEASSRNDRVSLKQIAQQSTFLIFIFTIPIILFIIIFNKPILLLFGQEFVSASMPLLILMIGQFINSITGSVGYILNMSGKEKIFRNIILFTTIVNIVLNYFFIKYYGMVGAATATAIATVLLYVIAFLFVKKYFGFYTFDYLYIIKGFRHAN